MVLKRKIDKVLSSWRSTPNHKPLTITGIRQAGKTFSIKLFCENNYDNVVYLNFMTNPEYRTDFVGSLKVNDLLPNISLRVPGVPFAPKKTVFFFDEIQECPRARLSLKSFAEDGRFDVISSGSYLGVKGYVVKDGTPLPVGYEELVTMRTMDFEEFCWANGFSEEQIDGLRSSFKNKKPLSSTALGVFNGLFNQYLCIGGFPEAVNIFIQTRNLQAALDKVKSISVDLENDFGRRVDEEGKPIFKLEEVSRIRSAYDLIPTFLGKENKRYIVSKIGEGKNTQQKRDALSYLEEAGIITRSYNLESLSTPLISQKVFSEFKVFPTDIGLLTSMLELGAAKEIVQGELGMGKGVIYEGLVADSLIKNNIPLFYFSKNPSPELDFVINYQGEATILEVKSENGNAKSAKMVLSNPAHYGKARLFKTTRGNISFNNGVFNFPYFLCFLLTNDGFIKTDDFSYQAVKGQLDL